MKKAFDAVQWMRKRRAEIDEEDRDLSWEEKRRKTREFVLRDPLLSGLCAHTSYAVEPSVTVARETGPPYGPGTEA